jgi:hypothetical protein
MDRARECVETVLGRVVGREEWFQGRELCEALLVRIAAKERRWDESLLRLESALRMAESSDLWAAAWLGAECADELVNAEPERLRTIIAHYAGRVQGLGYPSLVERYQELTGRLD